MKNKESGVDAAPVAAAPVAGQTTLLTFTREQMEDCWDFCRHNFPSFLSLLEWLQALPREDRNVQLDSARKISEHRKAEVRTSAAVTAKEP